MFVFVFFSLLIVFEIVADIFGKEYQLHSGSWRFCIALSSYCIANTFWLLALKHGADLARGGTVFAICCAIMAVVLGKMVYHEEVSSIQMTGIGLGILSLGLIFWHK